MAASFSITKGMFMVKRFISFYKPHLGIFIADLACALALAVIDLFYPMITRNILNEYIPDKNMKLLLIWSAIAFAISGGTAFPICFLM